MQNGTLHIRPYGDRALLVNFEQRIDPAINAGVIGLDRALQAANLAGVTFTIPAYCSLTVGFDPLVVSFEALREQIATITDSSRAEEEQMPDRVLRIPVCYEPAFGPDLPEVAQQTGLSEAEIVALHTATPFRVYMLGFLPGFPYLGRLPDELCCSRKTTPRVRVPARSVGLAGCQTGIYPTEAPGGWQLIGRTPVPVFSPEREAPFLFRPGDRIHFQAISATEYDRLEQAIAAKTFHYQQLYEHGNDDASLS